MPLLSRKKLKINLRDYVDITYVDRGGSGEVYRAQCDRRVVALKAFFPFHERRQLQAFPEVASTQIPSLIRQSIDFQEREFAFVTSISHPNIVHAVDVGAVNLSAAERRRVERDEGISGVDQIPVLISDFIEGTPLDKAIKAYALSPDEIAYALSRVAEALDYIHTRHEYMHADVKASNVLVRWDIREPILIDFALTKNLNFEEVDKTARTMLLGDWDLLPSLPDDHPLRQAKLDGLSREELKRAAFPFLDLYDFGLMLRAISPLCDEVFEDREQRYLRVLEYELTDWERVKRWKAGQLGERVRRLRPSESTPFGVPELAAPGVPEHTVVMPEAHAVPLTRGIEPLLATASFARLGTVNQLSLVDQIYPGAAYERRVHVLYTYELTRQLVAHLYSSARFRYLFDEQAVQQLLTVALLHDINHFPFLHTLQESQLPDVKRLQLFDMVCDGDFTGEHAAGRPSIYDLLEEQGITPDRFKRLVTGSFGDQTSHEDEVISSIINSGVDVDKLSYLRLDAHFTGVPYGLAIDIPTLMKAATVVPLDQRFHLAFGDRALSALEHAVFTRYWNFRSIYWHHTNRALMAMVLDVVRALYTERRKLDEYVRATAFSGEWGAVAYLDSEYQDVEGKPSILRGLEHDRGLIFKRIYTVHPTTDEQDRPIYEQFRSLDAEGERGFRRALASHLQEAIAGTAAARNVDIADVLVDVPRRDLDLGGAVWVSADRRPERLTALSKPVELLAQNYAALSQRARVFVAPWLREALRGVVAGLERDEVRKWVSAALREGAGPGEVS